MDLVCGEVRAESCQVFGGVHVEPWFEDPDNKMGCPELGDRFVARRGLAPRNPGENSRRTAPQREQVETAVFAWADDGVRRLQRVARLFQEIYGESRAVCADGNRRGKLLEGPAENSFQAIPEIAFSL